MITPAVAGPFDLGTVVVRTALYVDPATAQGHAVSDPLPTILEGIPLDVRSIAIDDRPPRLHPQPDQLRSDGDHRHRHLCPRRGGGPDHALPGRRLQRRSRFKPKLSLELKGKTKRTSHPKLIANLTARPGEANIASAQVKLPQSRLPRQRPHRHGLHQGPVRRQRLPAGSIYGTASATTPLLDYPLTGNVYLRSSSHQLPDLVADLNGPPASRSRSTSPATTDSVKGALRNTFEAVPDAPGHQVPPRALRRQERPDHPLSRPLQEPKGHCPDGGSERQGLGHQPGCEDELSQKEEGRKRGQEEGR